MDTALIFIIWIMITRSDFDDVLYGICFILNAIILMFTVVYTIQYVAETYGVIEAILTGVAFALPGTILQLINNR